MASNIVFLIVSGTAEAYYVPFSNKMELNTEMFIAIITYHLMAFSDFIPINVTGGLKTRTTMGYSFIFWVSILISINLYFALGSLLNHFRLKCIL